MTTGDSFGRISDGGFALSRPPGPKVAISSAYPSPEAAFYQEAGTEENDYEN